MISVIHGRQNSRLIIRVLKDHKTVMFYNIRDIKELQLLYRQIVAELQNANKTIIFDKTL